MPSLINDIVRCRPAAGFRISFNRLDSTSSLDLRDLDELARKAAFYLRELGIGPADRVGLLAKNCLEWVVLDLAALMLKAVTAGLEPGKFEITPALLEKYDLKLLFTDQKSDLPNVHDIGGLLAALAPFDGAAIEPVTYAPGDITTIKFTSGSTGRAKGLGATAASIDSSLRAVQEMFAHGSGDKLFVFLPLSLLQQRYWIYSALKFGHDVAISTYEAAFLALRREQPTVVMAVPAFYEALKKQIADSARRRTDVDDEATALRRAAVHVLGPNVRYLWTGSAPASPTVLRFFWDCGMPIFEGYGMNETCIVTKNHPAACKPGSVGRPVRGKHVIIDCDGVIRVRSDHPVNTRYMYCAPGESERVFAPNGTVRTGDLGYIDEDGFLFIRGRADDVIVLENGKKIIVRPMEEYMKASPAVAECVIFCVSQSHLVAVASPAQRPADEAAIARQLALTNKAFGADEQIKGVVVAADPFSVENGMLTSQYKPKRREILEKYRSQINNAHGGIHV
jgi:long-subunit acyl-CoA synthetase (AMP-forming)